MPASDRRVVITGLGLISPLGNSPTELKASLDSGRSGIGPLELLPTDHLPADFGGECKQFTGHIDNFGTLEKQLKRSIKKGLRLMCREIQMGVAASQLAIADAGLTAESCDPTRIGTLFGSDYIITRPEEFASGVQSCLNDQQEFQMTQWAENGLAKVEPLWLLKYLPNMPASHVAIYNQLRGPSNSLTVREASPNLAISEAMTIIQRGTADIMVAGATGSRIQPLRTLHVVLQEQLADRNAPISGGDATKTCRPFDSDRNGIVLGEGAGVMILEEYEFAKARGAKILGEVVGYSSSSVADSAGVANYKTAFENVIEGALETSGLAAADVGHVHAHGLGTIRCDAEEAQAINAKLGDTPVVAAKSLMGNLGGGSGMVEMIGSLLAANEGELFATANCDSLDPACPINLITETGTAAGDTFINLNVTPQGQASSIAIRKA
jgi:3-oxoacyl-[acyl-carrier-protein] synthase II